MYQYFTIHLRYTLSHLKKGRIFLQETRYVVIVNVISFVIALVQHLVAVKQLRRRISLNQPIFSCVSGGELVWCITK